MTLCFARLLEIADTVADNANQIADSAQMLAESSTLTGRCGGAAVGYRTKTPIHWPRAMRKMPAG